jgi:transposase
MSKKAKQNKSSAQKQSASPPSLSLALVRPHAAAIDVGSMNMMVSYSSAEGVPIVKEFGAFTQDLNLLAEELKNAGVREVGMEATGVYWMAVFEVLESNGFIVTLVNARHYKNVEGQKTDVKDCQWLHQLHAHGLLRSSHIVEECYRELRTYLQERAILQQGKSDTLNRMHKVLTQMNIKVQHLISDIEGVGGMQLLRSMAAGETNVEVLLSALNPKRLKATEEELTKSLQGQFKPQYITVLKNHLITYDFYKAQMKVYEELIEGVLKQLLPRQEDGSVARVEGKTTKSRKNQYHFKVREYLQHICGVDLAQIDGLDENLVLQIISVTGVELSKWPTHKHFTSWLRVSPSPMITGGRLIGHRRFPTSNAASQAFRLAAQTMWQNKGPLGNLYRRLCARKGSRVAIKAVANRIAIIFYHMLRRKTVYDPKIVVVNEEKLRAKRIDRLKKQAEKLGCRVEVAA